MKICQKCGIKLYPEETCGRLARNRALASMFDPSEKALLSLKFAIEDKDLDKDPGKYLELAMYWVEVANYPNPE